MKTHRYLVRSAGRLTAHASFFRAALAAARLWRMGVGAAILSDDRAALALYERRQGGALPRGWSGFTTNQKRAFHAAQRRRNLAYAAAAAPATATRVSRVGATRLDFNATASFSAALTLAREGWKEGREEAARVLSHVQDVTGSRARRLVTVPALAGFAPDVAAFLSGDPECMFIREEPEEITAAGKIVRIVCNIGASGGFSARDIMRRGVLAVALVDCLENLGFACELIGYSRAASGNRESSVTFVLKRAGEALDLDLCAFALAHPATLRRLVFSLRESDRAFISYAPDYGISQEAPENERGDIYFPRSYLGEADTNLAAWFRRQLSAVGITFDA